MSHICRLTKFFYILLVNSRCFAILRPLLIRPLSKPSLSKKVFLIEKKFNVICIPIGKKMINIFVFGVLFARIFVKYTPSNLDQIIFIRWRKYSATKSKDQSYWISCCHDSILFQYKLRHHFAGYPLDHSFAVLLYIPSPVHVNAAFYSRLSFPPSMNIWWIWLHGCPTLR